ncbi:hypothetical protein [Streptomyces sp. NPDC005281]|uniref:hypothetical protein n=1 Tax=Streptomyces sp. NPDC005281 TaxID=3155712 RepID=UPI0033BFA029
MAMRLVRLLGLATAAYSAAIMVRPKGLARPCGMTGPDSEAPPATATLIRAIGARDTVIGGATILDRGPHALRAVSFCRATADLCDAVAFGRVLDGKQRTKIAGFAAGWGVPCEAAAISGARESR